VDIFKDTCDHNSTDSLELDRIKAKVLEVWSQLLSATYEKEYHDMNEDSDDFVTLEHYLDHNKLMFEGDEQPEDEVDTLLTMFEDMLDPQEELESISGDSKAPTYSGTSLSAHKESSKAPKGTYDATHASTKTPSDSEIKAKSSSYIEPTGKTLTTKIHEQSAPISIKSIEDILKVERERLLRLVAKRNKQFGVRI